MKKKRLTQSEMNFLDKNPSGKIEDLSKELKQYIKSIFNIAEEIKNERNNTENC